MTTKTIQQCIPEAKRMFNRAYAKVELCRQQHQFSNCEYCWKMDRCDLVTTTNQMQTNLNEINRKANDFNQTDSEIH